MLYIPPRSSNLRRAQGTYISDAEVKSIVEFVKAKGGPVEYMDLLGETKTDLGDPMEEDDLYDQAVTAVLATKLGSASMLQRKFGIGYTRASRLIDMMCDHGVVGPHKGSKARELLITLEEWDAKKEAERKAAATRLPPPPDESGPLGNSDEDDGISDKGGSKNASGIASPWD
jgi:S-DNA-T family DNA segregation ATPase FtsK/SpoIIIE